MSETTSPATTTTEAPAKAPVAPRVKLIARIDGKEIPLLKYPFPTKAAKYPVKVNGAVVDSATTVGKGKAYTYLLINNTSFYVPGMLPVDAEVKVDFPEGYKFDDAVIERVSTYKSKKVKKAEAEAKAASEATAAVTAGPAQAEPATAEPVAPVPQTKAARRSR